MGRLQRTRGANTEREAAKYISARLKQLFKRKLGQAREGGNDLDVGCLAIEVKRRRKVVVFRWLEQAIRACNPATVGQIPAVVCREDDNRDFCIILRLDDFLFLAGENLFTPPPVVGDLLK